tara:strand:+ start:6073 stop:6585 length:513 start_codon:yes stop_codon:yes gene_type:complete
MKIKLRQFNKYDSDLLFQWINNKSLVNFNSSYNPIHEVSHDKWFDAISSNNSVRAFGICNDIDDLLIGTCQLLDLNFLNRTGELQIRIGNQSNQGKGFGSQAIALLLDFGFKDLNLNRISLKVFSDNKRAVAAYQKVGFFKEGMLRQTHFINGVYKDLVVMSILKSEYNV